VGRIVDLERAVDDFVTRGTALFRQLRREGESLSDLGLGTLRTQLLILNVEAVRLLQDRLFSKKKSKPEVATCFHRRAIDDVMNAQGEATGLVYCLECGGIVKDDLDD
jgi:hypothetical protein